jgi:formamidopyrimidine-DNA glycosylase
MRGCCNVPELPEVETLRRGIEAHLLDQRIVAVAIANPKILKGQSEAEFRDRTVGSRVLRADRVGKHLFFPLSSSPSVADSSWALHVHLNMRGSLRLAKDASEETGGHRCLTWTFEEGLYLHYHDVWGWGEVQAVPQGERPGQGPDALSGDWDEATLLKRLGARRSPIKSALLDQSVLGGVGNIYADEALHRAGVLPTRAAGALGIGEASGLAKAIRSVLAEAVTSGGSRGEFVDLWGETGRFVPKMYDRGGQPCPSCERPLEKIRLGGRGTTYCSHCQK